MGHNNLTNEAEYVIMEKMVNYKLELFRVTRLKLILTTIVALLAVLTAFYRFDYCKASKAEVQAVDGKLTNHQLTDYRKELVQRMWSLEREFPRSYMKRYDYRQLKEELRLLDIKINAYYRRKG